jgi:hypothetical protein
MFGLRSARPLLPHWATPRLRRAVTTATDSSHYGCYGYGGPTVTFGFGGGHGASVMEAASVAVTTAGKYGRGADSDQERGDLLIAKAPC